MSLSLRERTQRCRPGLLYTSVYIRAHTHTHIYIYISLHIYKAHFGQYLARSNSMMSTHQRRHSDIHQQLQQPPRCQVMATCQCCRMPVIMTTASSDSGPPSAAPTTTEPVAICPQCDCLRELQHVDSCPASPATDSADEAAGTDTERMPVTFTQQRRRHHRRHQYHQRRHKVNKPHYSSDTVNILWLMCLVLLMFSFDVTDAAARQRPERFYFR